MPRRKNYNYNYVFLFYDIGEKRVQKVFKICKKYLSHHQKSVFRGEIQPANLIKLRKELENIIQPNEDFVTIIKLTGSHVYSEETLGMSQKEIGLDFI